MAVDTTSRIEGMVVNKTADITRQLSFTRSPRTEPVANDVMVCLASLYSDGVIELENGKTKFGGVAVRIKWYDLVGKMVGLIQIFQISQQGTKKQINDEVRLQFPKIWIQISNW